MALPGSGPIKYSQVRSVTGQAGTLSASNFRFRVLANGFNSGSVKMSSVRNKPTAGTKTVTGASEPFTIPAYTNLSITISGAGGGGGTGCNTFFAANCFCGANGGSDGTDGNQSSFLSYIAFGGKLGTTACTGGATNPGAAGGNNVNGNLGGGAAGGAGIAGSRGTFNCPPSFGLPCPQYSGNRAGDGGSLNLNVIIGQTGPEYLTGTTIAGGLAGGNGTNGSVTISWS